MLSENLAFWMQQRGLNAQEVLAARAGVSQRTISDYLHPENRLDSKTGKEPSAKLTEVEKLARALDIGVWDLLRDLTPKERAFYRQVEDAYRKLIDDNPGGPDGNTQSGDL